MALTNKNAQAPQTGASTQAPTTNAGTAAPTTSAGTAGNGINKKKQISANEELKEKGKLAVASFTAEARENLGSKSGTLHFVHQLGFASITGSRKVGENTVKCSTPVGVKLTTDIEITDVPVIENSAKALDEGVNPDEIKYITVPAGATFNLTLVEFMYLIVRDEYAGFLEVNGNEKGAYLSVKLQNFAAKAAQLPTPTINFHTGSSKENMVDIDVKSENGWSVLPEYAEKFSSFLRQATPKRRATAQAATTIASPTLVAVALKSLLPGAK